MQGRPDFYRQVHKGIRSFLLDLVVEAGRTDWNDAASVDAIRARTEASFALLDAHAHKENEFLEPLLAKAAPEVAKILSRSHDEQDVQLAALRAQLAAIDPASPDAPSAGHRFVVALSRFAGESLVHMADEEEIAMTAMWNAFDDAALLEVHQRLVGSIPPDVMAAFLRWMLPAMNPPERVQLLGGIRATAPPPVFGFLLGLAAEVLSPGQHAALARGLEEVQHA